MKHRPAITNSTLREMFVVIVLLTSLASWQTLQAPLPLRTINFTEVFLWQFFALTAVLSIAVVLDRYLFRHWFRRSFFIVVGMRALIQLSASLLLTMATVAWYQTLSSAIDRSQYWDSFLFYGFSFFGATIIIESSKLAGSRFLDKLVLGRYHRPRKENRIFLFIDLKESTKLSNELPVELYSLLLKEFFRDIDGAMEKHGGEIYQYAGDQVIVSWLATPANYRQAVDAFRSFFKTIRNNRPKYIKRYGVVPRFKAAMHSGEVVGTWMGRLKRELVFQGEVLNIAARITSLAKNLSYPVLLTEPVVQQLDDDLKALLIDGGSYSLKGVEQPIPVYFMQVNQQYFVPDQTEWNTQKTPLANGALINAAKKVKQESVPEIQAEAN